MTAVVSMLRGVNVGGHNMIKMQELRALYESMGLRDPQTYVQSGNVVFTSAERDIARLSKRIEASIEQRFAIACNVILRTAAEMRDVIARNPFADRNNIDPRKLAVTFLAAEPGAEAQAKVRQIQTDPEEMRLHGRELYIYYPNGMGRSKLTGAVLERAMKIPGTARNWNTVTKLAEMAERAETSSH